MIHSSLIDPETKAAIADKKIPFLDRFVIVARALDAISSCDDLLLEAASAIMFIAHNDLWAEWEEWNGLLRAYSEDCNLWE